MGTRSTITALLSDGTYRSVYCHWDGYIEEPGVGWMLQKHYSSQKLAEKVTSLGALSSLDKSCDPPPRSAATKHIDGYSVAFFRDRGDDWQDCLPGEGATPEEALTAVGRQEYDYLWDGTRWQLLSDDPKDIIIFTANSGAPA